MAAAPDTPARPRRRTGERPASEPPALHVVDPPRRARRWIALMVLTALAGIAGITSLSAATAEAAFTARELEQEVTDLERAHSDLAGDVAELSSLERIARIAEEELGLVPAEEARYLEADPVDQVPAAHQTGRPADPVKAAREGRW